MCLSIKSRAYQFWSAIQPADRNQYLKTQSAVFIGILGVAFIDRKIATVFATIQLAYLIGVNNYPAKIEFGLWNKKPGEYFSENPIKEANSGQLDLQSLDFQPIPSEELNDSDPENYKSYEQIILTKSNSENPSENAKDFILTSRALSRRSNESEDGK